MANLADLFGLKTQSTAYMPQETQFRVKAFLMGFQPQNIAEFCVGFCPKCNNTESFTNLNNKNECAECSTERLPVFQVVLYLKDEHSMGLDEVYKIHYYSQVCQDPEAGISIEDPKFFRFNPCNLYQDD